MTNSNEDVTVNNWFLIQKQGQIYFLEFNSNILSPFVMWYAETETFIGKWLF